MIPKRVVTGKHVTEIYRTCLFPENISIIPASFHMHITKCIKMIVDVTCITSLLYIVQYITYNDPHLLTTYVILGEQCVTGKLRYCF